MRQKSLCSRLGALILCAALLLCPARALTVDQARELLEELYVDPVPPEVLACATVEEMLEALDDPFTHYLNAQEYEYFLASMADYTMGGIGVTTLLSDEPLAEGLEIDEVLPDSPAYKAGLQQGDIILAVDGTSLAGMTAQKAVGHITGEAGTDVTLTYRHRNRRHTRTLTRDVITIPATSGYMLEGDVGYISCDTWGEETAGHFRDLIGEMEDQAKCWLIDLRDNDGGLIDAAVETAGLFCGQRATAYLRLRGPGPGGYVYDFYQADEDGLTGKPVVILVDSQTASASELFTAILRDCGRAVVVGERTFGKGVSQGLFDQQSLPDYFPDGDCLALTYARVYSPRGNTNHIMGILPYIPVSDEEAPQRSLEVAQTLAQADFGLWPYAADQLIENYIDTHCHLSDVGGHPYETAITHLAAYGLVKGKGDGAFHPEDTLTRAELAQMLQNLLDYYPGTGAEGFGDVAADAWYSPAADAMVDMGFMEGVGDGLFAPDRVLTRQELFAVVGRMARYLNDDLNFAVLTMDDWQMELYAIRHYDDWAKESVWLMSRALDDGHGGFVNLLWENPEYLDPRAPATRAEAAEVLYNILHYSALLP